jgi:hypothetical protein
MTALSPALVLGIWLAGEEILRATQSGEERGAPRTSVGRTVEPQPDLALTVELGSLQKSARGGVARLLVGVSSGLDLSEVTLSGKVPADLVFADGSKARRWSVKRAARIEQVISVDVIVPRDGAFDISFELEGIVSTGGKPIRRGAAYELRIGVEGPLPPVRDGAIEYRISPEGGS